MTKSAMGTKLPKKLEQKMQIVSEQIRLVRLSRNLSVAQIAERATCLPLTVSRIEKGIPTVAIGIYLRVLYALQLDDDLLPIAAYHIAALICRAENFLKRIANDSYAGNILTKLTVLKTHLRPMLHPLSHYAPDEPVYKSELMQAEQLFSEISTLLEAANYKNRCKVVVPKHGKLLLQIRGRSGWNYNYKFDVEDHLISYTDAAGAKLITDVPLQVVEMFEGKPDGTTKSYFCSKNSRIYKIMHYTSIDDCVTKIVSFLSTPDGGNKHDAIYCLIIVICFSALMLQPLQIL